MYMYAKRSHMHVKDPVVHVTQITHHSLLYKCQSLQNVETGHCTEGEEELELSTTEMCFHILLSMTDPCKPSKTGKNSWSLHGQSRCFFSDLCPPTQC